MADSTDFREKKITGPAVLTNSNGDVLLHKHDEDGNWFCYQTDKVVTPCPHCVAESPLVNYLVRYVLSPEIPESEIVYIGARITEVGKQNAST